MGVLAVWSVAFMKVISEQLLLCNNSSTAAKAFGDFRWSNFLEKQQGHNEMQMEKKRKRADKGPQIFPCVHLEWNFKQSCKTRTKRIYHRTTIKSRTLLNWKYYCSAVRFNEASLVHASDQRTSLVILLTFLPLTRGGTSLTSISPVSGTGSQKQRLPAFTSSITWRRRSLGPPSPPLTLAAYLLRVKDFYLFVTSQYMAVNSWISVVWIYSFCSLSQSLSTT